MLSFYRSLANDFSKIDIYGVGFHLRYNQSSLFQSNFGAIITIIIGVLVLVQLYFSSLDLIQKRNPEVIQSELYQPNPTVFHMKKDTFNFSVGVQYPGNFTHFIDESIYELVVTQITMVKQYNDVLGQYEQIWREVEIPMRACQSSNYAINETRDYFLNLVNVKQMYCVEDENQDLFIQGNYDQETYALIRIEFRICSGKPYCRDHEEIAQILTHSFVAMYLTDTIVNPGELIPFKKIGKDLFWNNSPRVTRDIDIYFRNIIMESDEGVILSDTSKLRATQFSYQTESIILDEGKYFFSMQLRFEKQKETHYSRKYKKLDCLLADIGGISKALIMIGFLITYPLNKLKLSEKLINDLYHFQETHVSRPKGKTIQDSKQTTKETKKGTSQRIVIDDQERKNQTLMENICQKKPHVSIEIQESLKKDDFPQNLQIQDHQFDFKEQTKIQTNSNLRIVSVGEKKQSLLSTNNFQTNQRQDNTLDNSNHKFLGFLKSLHQSGQQGKFKLSWGQYIRYYIWPWGQFSKVKSQMEEVISQVYYHLDIMQIIKHQIEFEKVKALLFDEDQIRLIQFLPKPTLHLESSMDRNSEKVIKNIDLEVQKKQEALDSLAKLCKKKEPSKIDRKLMKIIEQNHNRDKVYNYDIQLPEYQRDLVSLQLLNEDIRIAKSFQTTLQSKTDLNKELSKLTMKNKTPQDAFLQSYQYPPRIRRQSNNEIKCSHNSDDSKQQIKINQNNESLSQSQSSCDILGFQFPDNKRCTHNTIQDGQTDIIPCFAHQQGQQKHQQI